MLSEDNRVALLVRLRTAEMALHAAQDIHDEGVVGLLIKDALATVAEAQEYVKPGEAA